MIIFFGVIKHLFGFIERRCFNGGFGRGFRGVLRRNWVVKRFHSDKSFNRSQQSPETSTFSFENSKQIATL